MKRVYQTPAMKVVKLQHRLQMLQASGQASIQSKRSGYGTADDDTWE